MRYSLEGNLTYTEAIELQFALRKQGIEAYISVGCVSAYPTNEQYSLLCEIAKEHRAAVIEGGSTTASLTVHSYSMDRNNGVDVYWRRGID